MAINIRRLRLVAAALVGAVLASAWTVWDAVRFKVPDEATLLDALGPLESETPEVQTLLRNASDAVPLAKPPRGDWLAEHPEEVQTFADYAALYPRQPRSGMRPIAVGWVGSRPEGWKSESEAVSMFLGLTFQGPVKEVADFPTEGIASRDRAGRRQLYAPAILERLGPAVPHGAACLLTLTAEDLYPKDSWNFIFGLASFEGRAGVHSVARLDSPDRATRLRRVLIVAGHEAGHAFGLRHCVFRRCLMNGINSLDELDRKSTAFCPICLRKLAWGAGIDILRMHRELAVFLAKVGLPAEASIYQLRLQAGREVGQGPAPRHNSPP